MSSDTLGILIIIFFIVLGVITGGKIFGTGYYATSTAVYQTNSGLGHYTDENGFIVPINDNSSSQSRADTAQQVEDISQQVSILSRDVQKYVENRYDSPYKYKVAISEVNEAGSLNEYIVLDTNFNDGEELLLSGWRLRSTVTGSEIVIGNAVNIPGVNSQIERSIVVAGNSQIIVQQGRSPIGISFRINKCAGYLQEIRNFRPALQSSCPEVSEDAPALSNTIDNECLDYIDNLPRCKIPDDNDFPEDLSRSCEDFLETQVNYGSCVANHQYDRDFLTHEWRFYAGHTKLLWLSKRDNIQLLDNAGLVVDTYTY